MTKCMSLLLAIFIVLLPYNQPTKGALPNPLGSSEDLHTTLATAKIPSGIDLGYGLVVLPHSAWPKETGHTLLLPSGRTTTYFMHEHKLTERLVPRDRHINIFSTCLFRPREERNERATDYVAGIVETAEILQKRLPDWILRIYFDASLIAPESSHEADAIWIPLLQKLAKTPNVQLVQYYFPKFSVAGDDFHHQGLFGMLVRFMAAFDPKVDRMFSWDADSKVTDELISLIDAWMVSDYESLIPFFANYIPWWGINILHQAQKPGFPKFFVLGGYWGTKHLNAPEVSGRLFESLFEYDAAIQIYPRNEDSATLNSCSFGFDEILLNKVLLPILFKKPLVSEQTSSCCTVVPSHQTAVHLVTPYLLWLKSEFFKAPNIFSDSVIEKFKQISIKELELIIDRTSSN